MVWGYAPQVAATTNSAVSIYQSQTCTGSTYVNSAMLGGSQTSTTTGIYNSALVWWVTEPYQDYQAACAQALADQQHMQNYAAYVSGIKAGERDRERMARPPVRTPEEQAELMRRQVERQAEIIERQRQAKAELDALNQRRYEGRERSKQLLLSHLTPAQQKTFTEKGWFVVEGGKSKTKYKINTNAFAGNVDILSEDGKRRTGSMCCHASSDAIAHFDHHLAQKLMLEGAEDDFRRIANVTPRRDAA